ncbi:hypothetical protein [Maribellus mangrovi]|uniref:hypothetical protein n=1 Tax=Maribellus mangrovi TaxID=3133146 RepID=UPI0030EC035D
MKKFSLLLVLCLVVGAFYVNNLQAQEAEDPGLIFLMEEFVAPADLAQFWEVQQEAIDLFNELDLNMTVWAYQTSENSFYWAMPIKNFAGIDELYASMMNVSQKMKENGFDGDAKFRDLSNISQSVVMWNKELSFHPDGDGQDEEGKGFHEWSFIYLKSGHEKEAAEAAKKYIEFYKSIGTDYSWDIYQVVFGEHTPCWILEVQDVSEAALRETEDAMMKEYRDDFRKLWQNMVQHVRTIETKKGWFLPGWSMQAE